MLYSQDKGVSVQYSAALHCTPHMSCARQQQAALYQWQRTASTVQHSRERAIERVTLVIGNTGDQRDISAEPSLDTREVRAGLSSDMMRGQA